MTPTTKEQLQKILDKHKLWLDGKPGGERANLGDARLYGVNLLREADLRYADLRGATLNHADLGFADLEGADLREASLRGADLTCAILIGATLKRADLSGADLEEADLSDADLRETNFYNADLSSADLTYVILNSADLIGANLRDADLTGATLRGVDLKGANLKGVNPTGTDLREADLESASFTGAMPPALEAVLASDDIAVKSRFINEHFGVDVVRQALQHHVAQGEIHLEVIDQSDIALFAEEREVEISERQAEYLIRHISKNESSLAESVGYIYDDLKDDDYFKGLAGEEKDEAAYRPLVRLECAHGPDLWDHTVRYQKIHGIDEIHEITSEMAQSLIETNPRGAGKYKYEGRYIVKNDNNTYTAIDNSSGNAWFEDFKSLESAKEYLSTDKSPEEIDGWIAGILEPEKPKAPTLKELRDEIKKAPRPPQVQKQVERGGIDHGQ